RCTRGSVLLSAHMAQHEVLMLQRSARWCLLSTIVPVVTGYNPSRPVWERPALQFGTEIDLPFPSGNPLPKNNPFPEFTRYRSSCTMNEPVEDGGLSLVPGVRPLWRPRTSSSRSRSPPCSC